MQNAYRQNYNTVAATLKRIKVKDILSVLFLFLNPSKQIVVKLEIVVVSISVLNYDLVVLLGELKMKSLCPGLFSLNSVYK